MDLHLTLPNGLAHEAIDWISAGQAVTTELVQSSTDGDEEETSTAGTIVSFLPLLLIVAAVYFLLLRPRQRQMKQQRQLQSTLEVGDEVMLTFGVIGFITGFEEGSDIVWVEIDDDVQIRVTRRAISGTLEAGASPGAGERGDGSAEVPSAASRRPTLKGGGTKPPPASAAPATTPAPGSAPTSDDNATGETPEE